MPTQAAQTFAAVLAKPVAKLQQDLVVATTSIFLSFASDEDLSNFAINQDAAIVVRPKGFSPDVGVQAGGGRYIFKFDGTLTVSIWNRLWVDQAGRDTSWLTDAALGTALLIHNVLDSLEQYMPTDSSGHYMLIEPMRLLPPGFNFPAKKVGEWGIVTSEWSFQWNESLTLPTLSN